MRRSFKEHLYGFCELKGYKHVETQNPWSMIINDVITVTKERGGYVARDTVLHLECWAKASAWELLCLYIQEIVNKHN